MGASATKQHAVWRHARGVPGGVAPHSPLHRFMWLSSWSPIENCSVGSARAGRVDINRKKALFLNFFSSDIFNIPLAVAVEILGNGKTEKELNKNKKSARQASKQTLTRPQVASSPGWEASSAGHAGVSGLRASRVPVLLVLREADHHFASAGRGPRTNHVPKEAE